ncbi:MAG: ArnT family glycosyltransferase, partial [Thermoplasmata archaeon]
SKGYALYSELPCDQAPLAFYIGALLGGEVIGLRVLQASLSLLAIAACMEAARRMQGTSAMLVTGLLLSLDFAFLRESRLFSLDGLSSYFVSFSLLTFVIYVQRNSAPALVASGLLIGMSTATKLFGALVLVGMLVFMAYELARNSGRSTPKRVDFLVLVVVASIPMAVFMACLGPSEMLDGMLFSQGHREFDPFLKLSIPAYFGLNLAYLLPFAHARALWNRRPETRFFIVASVLVFAFMLLQPLTFFHHLAFISPLLAISAGIAIAQALDLKKAHDCVNGRSNLRNKSMEPGNLLLALFLSGIVVSSGLAFYGPSAQKEPAQARYAGFLREISGPEDWVISGDPLICAYADRMIPPGMVNVAYRQYPDITLDDIERAIVEYDVSTVIVCYRLSDMEGLRDILTGNNYTETAFGYSTQDQAVLDLFEKGIGPVTFYVKSSS